MSPSCFVSTVPLLFQVRSSLKHLLFWSTLLVFVIQGATVSALASSDAARVVPVPYTGNGEFESVKFTRDVTLSHDARWSQNCHFNLLTRLHTRWGTDTNDASSNPLLAIYCIPLAALHDQRTDTSRSHGHIRKAISS